MIQLPPTRMPIASQRASGGARARARWVVSTAMSINSPSTTPAAAARAGDRSQRDWSARPAAPPGRRDARGLTFSVVIPARVMQPKTSERGKQSWRLALCCYGMTLALHHRVQRCVSHRLRNSAVRPGSGDPWPDSVGG